MPNPYTLREALDAVGKRLHGDAWTGKEADIPERPAPMILGWLPMLQDGTPAPPTDEVRRNLERARTQTHEPEPESVKDARRRLNEARNTLRDFIRHGRVGFYLLTPGGKRWQPEPAEWEATGGRLWLNYAASSAGYTDPPAGRERGEVFIDRGKLDACLSEILSSCAKARERDQASRRRCTTERNEHIQARANEIWRDDPALSKAKVAEGILKEQGENLRDHRTGDSKLLRLETIERIIRRPPCSPKPRRARPGKR